MFTGIVEEIGTIRGIRKGNHSVQLKIEAKKVLEQTNLGDSICVNGVCLTVCKLEKNSFYADVMHETLNRTNLGNLGNGSHVHLERAMSPMQRFGGHIVTGHIDGMATIVGIEKDDTATWYEFEVSDILQMGFVEKGSVAIDGISLTVAKIGKNRFSISMIPHTKEATCLFEKQLGDQVNIENDILGKYVQKYMAQQNVIEVKGESKKSRIVSLEYLQEHGF